MTMTGKIEADEGILWFRPFTEPHNRPSKMRYRVVADSPYEGVLVARWPRCYRVFTWLEGSVPVGDEPENLWRLRLTFTSAKP